MCALWGDRRYLCPFPAKAEFNRYASKLIEIVTPSLQKLEISGVFTTDDPAAFIAFLRSMGGVQVEETATRFRVSRDHR
jgi:ferric-dicitrate binding protein FerR (iron transport regulator)